MIRAVVFDLDGTLVCSKVRPEDLRQEVLKVLSRLGLPPSFFSRDEELPRILEKVEAYLKASGFSEGDMAKFWGEITRALEAFEEAYAKTASPIPGAIEILASLREKGLKIGLVSFSDSAVVMNLLAKLGIKRFLDVLVARDFVDDPRPNSAHLLRALRDLGVEPGEAVLVSRSPSLIRYAKDVGMWAIGMAKGCGEEELRRAGSDLIAGSLSEVLSAISELGQRA